MEPLMHNPGAEAVAAQVIANAARGLAGGTTASAAVTGLAPAGADEVSLMAAAGFAFEGVEALTQNTFAQEELARAGTAYSQAAATYAAVDAAQATTF
ncbi:PE family protein [Mycobacterium sp. NPDC003449]